MISQIVTFPNYNYTLVMAEMAVMALMAVLAITDVMAVKTVMADMAVMAEMAVITIMAVMAVITVMTVLAVMSEMAVMAVMARLVKHIRGGTTDNRERDTSRIELTQPAWPDSAGLQLRNCSLSFWEQ